MLREAGLVEVRTDAQRRLYRVRPEPLAEIDEWLAPYRRLWGNGSTTSSDTSTRRRTDDSQDGTHETLDDGRHRLRFERHLRHPIDRVWRALTEPDEIEAWLARADVDLRSRAAAIHLEWLNTDENGEALRGRGAAPARSPGSSRRT